MVLFWLACIVGDVLPAETLGIGPSLMVFGVILIERRKRTNGRADGSEVDKKGVA